MSRSTPELSDANAATHGWLARLGRDRVAGLVLILIAVGVIFEARALPLGSLQQPGPGYLPVVTALLMGMLGALVAIRDRGPRLKDIHWQEFGHAAALLGGCAFAALFLERLGYRLTVAALLVFFLGALERRSWIAVLLVSFGLAFGSYFLFADMLRVLLPRGPFGI